MAGPRAYSELTKKRLYALSGNQCAFPGCMVSFMNIDDVTNLSNICHIKDAEPGGRYDETMTDKQRADFSNLILLCPTHHKETDNVEKYPVVVLEKMKLDHESIIVHRANINNLLMLSNVINAIAAINIEDIKEIETLNTIDIADKIAHNYIKRNKTTINEYKVYHAKINALYDELEREGSIKKEKLLSIIKQIYIRVKGRYILDSDDAITIIRENADNIIDDVSDELCNRIKDLNGDDIFLGINLVIVDAFMRCKILEEPPIK